MDYKINVNLDKACIKCGKKGAMDNGYCLECVTDGITEAIKGERRKSMAETNVNIKQIEKLKVSGQVVEEKDSEGEVIKRYMTTVAFQFEGLPGELDPVIVALTSDYQVGVSFGSPQTNLGADFMRKENRV